jgi:glycosyltransferase involved in cell wall biosynthesis
MLAAWSLWGTRHRKLEIENRHSAGPDVVVIGTDPILGVLVAPVIKRLRPQVRIVHWAFDLYPESAIADGLLREDALMVRGLRRLLRRAYARCDLVADLGSCMRARLDSYGHASRKTTLVPWALAEPDAVEHPNPEVRRCLFPSLALRASVPTLTRGIGEANGTLTRSVSEGLGLLYSGNFGRAHSFTEFLDLARRVRGDNVHFAFGIRGNRAADLRAALEPGDTNVTLAGFAPEGELVQRLTAADIHLVSLRPEWTGLVVPSKFFGSLAAGRPVLFAGARDCAIARWIEQHGVGWVLDAHSVETVAAQLRFLKDHPEHLLQLQWHCQRIYHECFSRRQVMDSWDQELRRLLPMTPGRPAKLAGPNAAKPSGVLAS